MQVFQGDLLYQNIVHGAQGAADIPLFLPLLGFRRRVRGDVPDVGVLHGHKLAKIDQLVHPSVYDGVVFRVVALLVHDLSEILAAAGRNAPAKLQGNGPGELHPL